MFDHAYLDESNICNGSGSLKNIESRPGLVYLPEGWNDDFLWRKWENGQWSAEKFEPIPPNPGPDLPAEIDLLKAENASLNQQLAQTNADAVAFQEFIFTSFPELS